MSQLSTFRLPPPAGYKIEDRLIQRFSSLAELEKYAKDTMDVELEGKIKIMRTYHSDLPGHISRIRAQCALEVESAGKT